MEKLINKPNQLTLVGIAMVLFGASFLSFILFAVVAAIVGENRLEKDSGLTILGTIIFYVPFAASIFLIIYDLFLRKTKVSARKFPLRKSGFLLAIGGTVLSLVGYISLLTYDQDKGANIGAGFLVFGGGFIFIIGFLLALISLVIDIPKPTEKPKP